MKRIFAAIICAVLIIISLSSCSKNDGSSSGESSIQPILTFSAGDVTEIRISTLPEMEKYDKTVSSADGIEKVIGYINSMPLSCDYSQNPDELEGVTTNIVFSLSNGAEVNVYQLGNKFIRADANEWYEIPIEEAQELLRLLAEQN